MTGLWNSLCAGMLSVMASERSTTFGTLTSFSSGVKFLGGLGETLSIEPGIECVSDLLPRRSGPEEQREEEARLQPVERSCVDQPALEQVGLGADEPVGRAEDLAGLGARSQDDRHLPGELFQRLYHDGRDVSAAHGLYHQPGVPLLLYDGKEPPVVAQGDGEQRHLTVLCVFGERYLVAPRRAQNHPWNTLGDPADRPDRVRAEGCRVRGVRLAHEPRRVDLVVQDDHPAETPCSVARRDLDRGQQVGRTIGTGKGGVAHRTRDHYGGVAIHQQIEDKRGLLYGVGALRDDRTARAFIYAVRDLRRELGEITHRNLAGRGLPKRGGRYLGSLGYLGHVRNQRLPGQRRLDAFSSGVNRRDG